MRSFQSQRLKPSSHDSTCVRSDSLRHSILSTSNLSRRRLAHKSTSTRFGLGEISESPRSSPVRKALILFRIYLKFPKNFLTILATSIPKSFPKYNLHSTDTISSTHATSQQDLCSTLISIQVRVTQRSTHEQGTFYLCWKLRGGNIIPSPNGMIRPL